MISKKQLEKYFKSISSDVSCRKKGGNDPARRQLYEYMVRNYAALDKGARLFANAFFDAMDRAVQEKIDALPQGDAKRALGCTLSVIRGQRSPIAILYLDTPVLERIIQYGLGQPATENTKALYEKIRHLVECRRLVCPENTFQREMLQMAGRQAREGLDMMRKLSFSLSFRHSQSIEDAQVLRAIQNHINGNSPLNFRDFWTDALTKRAVLSILKICPSVALHQQKVLREKDAPEAGQPGKSVSHRLRVRFDAAAFHDDHALFKRFARHSRDLVRLCMRYRSMAQKRTEAHGDGFWSKQKTDLPLALWNHFSGKPEGLEGLVSLYESDAVTGVPAIRIKRDIWNVFSERQAGRPERLTGASDIAVLSALLPYTDMMILGPRMTHVVRDVLKLHAAFDTEIVSINEHEQVLAALGGVSGADRR